MNYLEDRARGLYLYTHIQYKNDAMGTFESLHAFGVC